MFKVIVRVWVVYNAHVRDYVVYLREEPTRNPLSRAIIFLFSIVET